MGSPRRSEPVAHLCRSSCWHTSNFFKRPGGAQEKPSKLLKHMYLHDCMLRCTSNGRVTRRSSFFLIASFHIPHSAYHLHKYSCSFRTKRLGSRSRTATHSFCPLAENGSPVLLTSGCRELLRTGKQNRMRRALLFDPSGCKTCQKSKAGPEENREADGWGRRRVNSKLRKRKSRSSQGCRGSVAYIHKHIRSRTVPKDINYATLHCTA